MTDIGALLKNLESRKEDVFSVITEAKSVEYYNKLMKDCRDGKIDEKFRKLYRHFYRLNRAFLTDEFYNEYFTLLKNHEKSLERVLEKLHKIEIHKGKNTYQLSFATKLLHTNNPKLPIYDKNIASIPELQLVWHLETYKALKRVHAELLKREDIKKLIDVE